LGAERFLLLRCIVPLSVTIFFVASPKDETQKDFHFTRAKRTGEANRAKERHFVLLSPFSKKSNLRKST
ncbi:MAG TPA: hypothetical protein VJU52_01705, partial [Flavobacterium sp.]|nr:hypothetical protein [Flavobacterium sp.]